MRPSQLVQILAALGAMRDRYSNATGSKRSRRKALTNKLFVGKPAGGRLPLGVWQRTSDGLRPLLIFVPMPNYKRRFNFFDVAARKCDVEFPLQYSRALAERMSMVPEARRLIYD